MVMLVALRADWAVAVTWVSFLADRSMEVVTTVALWLASQVVSSDWVEVEVKPLSRCLAMLVTVGVGSSSTR